MKCGTVQAPNGSEVAVCHPGGMDEHALAGQFAAVALALRDEQGGAAGLVVQ